jgi:hypothetical protein
MMLLAMTVISCVDRKTQKEEGDIRLETPKDNSADTDFTESTGMTADGKADAMSNEDLTEIAEAKGIINDYYDAFTRKTPREAFDMWNPTSNNLTFSKFTEENPNYEKITVAFEEEDMKVKQADSVYTATIPLRVSATDAEGNISNSSGVATLKKDAKEDNAKYKIESMDLKKEDS